MKKVTSWGRFPNIEGNIISPSSQMEIQKTFNSHLPLIPRGNGKSYGDSALSKNMLSSRYRDHLIQLDTVNSTIQTQTGVTMDFLLRFLVPRGLFLPVVPGTKYISIGGAIASDIHGKNHHKEGTFTDHVKSFSLFGSSGNKIVCSRENNAELFFATCGGMGLTGFIDDVEFSLRKIRSSRISQTTHKAKNLDELFDLFEQYQNTTYSVAWIDSTCSTKDLGRGILLSGEHENDGSLDYKSTQFPFSTPLLPQWILNSYTVGSFNTFYYHHNFKKFSQQSVPIDAFFFPLDKLKNWNRLYGKNGFTQYQFVLPKETSKAGIKTILKKISEEKNASFLAVLKLFGKQNENYLSFPIEGYTLALDFKITPTLFTFLGKLNELVIEYGGRIYLSKDVCLTKEHFQKMYGNNAETFQNVRNKHNAIQFQSLQSRRLGL